MSASVEARDVGVRFLFDRQQRLVTPMLARLRRRGSEVWGIRGIDLSVGAGESVALVGPSGAGKTTLLRTLAHVLVPDEGALTVRGRIGSLLSVEAGLTPALTGRENCALLAVLVGFTREEVPDVIEDVKRRSGLGQAFERPVASYSQGMSARLGFAVIERADPSVLLLDEVHEALDAEFRAEVQQFAIRLLGRGGIVFAAGHDLALLEGLCDRAVLLEGGSIRADGPFVDVRDVALAL